MLSLTQEESMPKLTDSQLIVRSKAAARDDGAAAVPEGIAEAAAAKVGSSLVARKLMREIRSKPGMPIWREADGKNISLVITRAGRDAIGEYRRSTGARPCRFPEFPIAEGEETMPGDDSRRG
jgi:hypothetical protein